MIVPTKCCAGSFLMPPRSSSLTRVQKLNTACWIARICGQRRARRRRPNCSIFRSVPTAAIATAGSRLSQTGSGSRTSRARQSGNSSLVGTLVKLALGASGASAGGSLVLVVGQGVLQRFPSRVLTLVNGVLRALQRSGNSLASIRFVVLRPVSGLLGSIVGEILVGVWSRVFGHGISEQQLAGIWPGC